MTSCLRVMRWTASTCPHSIPNRGLGRLLCESGHVKSTRNLFVDSTCRRGAPFHLG
jgi:hypothetical protein